MFNRFANRFTNKFTSTFSSFKSPFTNFSRFSRPFSSFTRGLGNKYSEWLDKYPYTTQCVQSGILGGAGDATTQWLEHRWAEEEGEQAKPWDFVRLFAVAFFGVYFMGPTGHKWYEWLEAFCKRKKMSKKQMIFTKVCGDTFVYGPVCLAAFFASVSLMEGVTPEAIYKKMRREFVPTYIVDYSMWPVIQGINFMFFPVRHQLLVVNIVCYFDDIFLSYIQHNGIPKIFLAIEDWWAEYIGITDEDEDETPNPHGGKPKKHHAIASPHDVAVDLSKKEKESK